MDKNKTQELLKKVIDEIQKCYDNWDVRIENNQQPVPIQDLDFWIQRLKSVLNDIREAE